MKYLLVTHIFIWFIEDNPMLSKVLRTLTEGEENEKYISLTSFYEIAIKVKIKKLTLNKSLRSCIDEIREYDITLLPISENHIITYEAVPLIATHCTPFNRLIIATALYENLTILTADKQLDNYKAINNIIS